MKKIMICVLVLALTLTMFAGCGKKETLELYLEAGFAPFEYVDGSEIVGVDVEIAQAIADELGWELNINDVPFDGICAGLSAPNAIAATGMTITEDRKEQVDFSTPYFESTLAVIAKKGSIELDADGKVPVATVKALKIGTQTGTTGDTYVFENIKPDTKSNGYVNVLNAYPDLKDGIIDVVIIDNLVALITSSGAGLSEEYGVYPLADCEVEQYGVATAKGNTELAAVVDKVVKEMLASGEIEALIEKHKSSAQ